MTNPIYTLHLSCSDGSPQTVGITGVRYARGCHPNDLWTVYFTSSKSVKKIREEYGEPDVIEIRQIFNDSLQAREWEHKVLRRINAVKDERWLNEGNGQPLTNVGKPLSEECKKKISDALKGRILSEETKQKMRKPKSKGTPKSEITKKRMSDAKKGKSKGKPISEEHKNKIRIARTGVKRGVYKKKRL